MELSILRTEDGDRLRVGPALVRRLVDETAGLERVLARREGPLGEALERDLFPDGPPERVLPSDVRRALANRLSSALHAWAASSPAQRAQQSMGDVVAPLRAIAESVGGECEEHDELHDYLFPAGVPERVDATALLRAFRHAAAREQRSLVRLVSLAPAFEGHDTLIEHEMAGRAVLVVRLWLVAVKWYALAAGRAGAAHARSFQALVDKWASIERQIRMCIDA